MTFTLRQDIIPTLLLLLVLRSWCDIKTLSIKNNNKTKKIDVADLISHLESNPDEESIPKPGLNLNYNPLIPPNQVKNSGPMITFTPIIAYSPADQSKKHLIAMKSGRRLDAMKSEYDSLMENNSWEPVDLPEGKSTESCRRVLTKKYKVDDSTL